MEVDNARVKKKANRPTNVLHFPKQDPKDESDVYAYLDGTLVMPCSSRGIREVLRRGYIIEDKSESDVVKNLIK